MNCFTHPPRFRLLAVGLLAGVLLFLGTCRADASPSHRPATVEDIQKFFPCGVASWYDLTPKNVRKVASGRQVKVTARLAAHRDLPFGSWLIIRNRANGRTILVEVLDRGPYIVGRDLDLSKAAFAELADLDEGLIKFEVLNLWIP